MIRGRNGLLEQLEPTNPGLRHPRQVEATNDDRGDAVAGSPRRHDLDRRLRALGMPPTRRRRAQLFTTATTDPHTSETTAMNIDDFARNLELNPGDLAPGDTGRAGAAHSVSRATPQQPAHAAPTTDLVAANAKARATPLVRAEANRLGVSLAQLELANGGTDNLRISLAQVRDAAARQRPLPPPAAVAAIGSGRVTRASLFDSYRQVTVDEYGLNPVLDDMRQIHPEKHAAGVAAGDPPPSLFVTGNLPVYTASGLPVTALSALPWSARIPAARADHAEATQIINYFTPGGGRDRAELAAEALMFFRNHEGNREYIGSVTSWLSGFQYRDGRWTKATTLGW